MCTCVEKSWHKISQRIKDGGFKVARTGPTQLQAYLIYIAEALEYNAAYNRYLMQGNFGDGVQCLIMETESRNIHFDLIFLVVSHAIEAADFVRKVRTRN
jgi:hypothetical protein